MIRLLKAWTLRTLIVASITSSAQGTPPKIVHPFGCYVKPLGLTGKPGPVQLQIGLGEKPGGVTRCDEVQIGVTTGGGIIYSGSHDFVATLDEARQYSTTLDLKVTANSSSEPSVSTVTISFTCGERSFVWPVAFVASEDTVGYIPWYRPKQVTESQTETDSVDSKTGSERYWHRFGINKRSIESRDDLTAQQLRTEHWLVVAVSSTEERQIAEKIVGKLPDSAACVGVNGAYLLKITLEDWLDLSEAGLDVVSVEEIAPRTRDSLGIDSAEEEWQIKKEGASLLSPSGVSLEYVDGEDSPGVLPTGEEIAFYIRYNNATGVSLPTMSNGFRVYSPDGAQWGSLQGDTVSLGWDNMFDFWTTVNHFSPDGTGADTVGFLFSRLFMDGWPIGQDEVSVTLRIGPIDPAYHGKTICLDKSEFGVSGEWAWFGADNGTYYPDWDGPHCYTIVSPVVEFHGYANYWDIRPDVNSQTPIANAAIEMWDDDYIVAGGDVRLDSTRTGSDGFFELGPVANYDGLLQNELDVYFRIYPENDAAYVTLDPGDDPYYWRTPVAQDLASGYYDTVFEAAADLDSSGPFFLAETVAEGRGAWTAVVGPPWEIPPQVEIVHWHMDSTYYDKTNQRLKIGASLDASKGYPDTYDEDMILHEYAHHLENTAGFFDESPGGTHEWFNNLSSTRKAASEGFADFWPAYVRTSDTIYNWYDSFTKCSWYNMETGEWGTEGSANHFDGSEAQVACLLWDIFDGIDDDYSECGLFPGCQWPWPTNQDGISDTITLGMDPIVTTLVAKQADDGNPPDDIDEFLEAWVSDPHNEHLWGVQDDYYEHGISCCVGMRGDVNNSGDAEPTIGDISKLIDYILIGRQPLTGCIQEANVNGDDAITVADLSLLVDYLFVDPGVNPPPDCPCVP